VKKDVSIMYRVMSFEIITYANKSQGMFEELVNNKFGVPVKVLGWGTKWKGFSDKTDGVLKYLETKNDTDLIIFLDGFDTKINKKPDKLVELFKQFNCKVLLSSDPNISGKFITRLIFGTCKGSGTANAGMYMGYAKELRDFLKSEENIKCKDDQVNFNTLCRSHDYVHVDENNVIFHNFRPIDARKESNALFVSYPGSPGLSRYSRALVEYTQFVYIYILCLLVLAMAFLPRHKNVLVGSTLGLTAFYVFTADKSCTV
jgi:hypothetical protein